MNNIIYNYIKETILVPRNIEARKEKLRQYNIELLSQEVIEGNLNIDQSFENINEELVKVKEIKGHVSLYLNYIPSWLKNIKIYGDFDCSGNNLTSLKNCPQYIRETLYCDNNYLTSLEGCAKYIGRNLFFINNDLTSLEGGPEYIGGDFYCYGNKTKLQLPKDIELKGKFIN